MADPGVPDRELVQAQRSVANWSNLLRSTRLVMATEERRKHWQDGSVAAARRRRLEEQFERYRRQLLAAQERLRRLT